MTNPVQTRNVNVQATSTRPRNPLLPKLESAGDALLRLAPAIGQGLSNIIQPNAERNELLKNFLAANPDQIDVFIDAAQSNPEQFEELFGKDSTSRFGLMELSPKFAKEKENALRLSTAIGNLTDSELEDAARVEVEIGTEAERKIQTSEATIRAQAARLAPGLAQEQLLGLADRLKSRDAGREELDALRVKIGAITIEKLLKDNRIDTLSDDALLQLSPGIRDEVFKRLAFDRKLRLAKIEGASGDTALFNRVADPLIDAAARLGVNPVALLMGKLDMTAQEVFQAFPQIRVAAQNAALDPQAVKEAVTAFDSEIQSKVIDEIVATTAQADEGSFASKAAAALKINTLLREIGITGITARMDDRGALKLQKSLQFFDTNDKLISAEEVTAMIADQLGLGAGTGILPLTDEEISSIAASDFTEEQINNDETISEEDRSKILAKRASSQ